MEDVEIHFLGFRQGLFAIQKYFNILTPGMLVVVHRS